MDFDFDESFLPQPYVKIVEQPANALRFRYSSEGTCAGSILGANSTQLNKTFPTIQVSGYRGQASVVVSCVWKDPPYRQHPHKLVGKEGCENGICTLPISEETMSVTFSNLGIQCTSRKDIVQSLRLRESMGIDPFKADFSHAQKLNFRDLKSLRLCFQVYLEEPGNRIALDPVVSNTIIYQKVPSRPAIVKLSKCVCDARGSEDDIMMFCNEVDKCDIQILFHEKINGKVVWEDFGLFVPKDVHKKYGISFRAPHYKNVNITKSVNVFIQLKRASDGAVSEEYRFEYIPIPKTSVPLRIGIKRGNSLLDELKKYQDNLNSPSTSNVQMQSSFNSGFSPNIPSLAQMYCTPNNTLGATLEPLPMNLPSTAPSTSNVEMNGNFNLAFHQNISLLDQLSCSPLLEGIPNPLPNFEMKVFSTENQTSPMTDHLNEFLNTNNLNASCHSKIQVNKLNLIDSDIRNEDLLEPNSFSNIPFKFY